MHYLMAKPGMLGGFRMRFLRWNSGSEDSGEEVEPVDSRDIDCWKYNASIIPPPGRIF